MKKMSIGKKIVSLLLVFVLVTLGFSHFSTKVMAQEVTISQPIKDYGPSSGSIWLVKVDLEPGTINSFKIHNLSSGTYNGDFKVYRDDNGQVGTLYASQPFSNLGTGEQTIQDINIDITTSGTYWAGVESTANFAAYGTMGSDLIHNYTSFGYRTGNFSIFFVLTMTLSGAPSLPAAPTNLSAVSGDGQITLDWSAVTDATSYHVKRSGTAGGSYTTIASGLTNASYIDTTVSNGTTYHYVVTAVNANGESLYSNEASAVAGQTIISQPEKTYNNSDASTTWLVKVNLDPGTIQSFKVHNSYSGTYSGNFNVFADNNGTVGTLVTSQPFTNLGAGEQTIQDINIDITTSGTYWVGLGVNTAIKLYGALGTDLIHSYMDYGYRNGNFCPFFVLTMNAPASPTLPAAPTNLTAASGDGQVTLGWDASLDATSYNVKRSTTAGGPYSVIASNLTALTYIDTTVSNGTTYYYVVTAVNDNGESTNSNEAMATPQIDLPATPTDLTAVPGDGQVTLNWVAVPNASSYTVKRSTTPGGPYTVIETGITTISYVDITVSNGTTYYYIVTAVNAGGESTNSNEASATPQASTQGRAILEISLIEGNEKEYDLGLSEVNAFLSWYDSRSAGQGPSYYVINKNDNLGPFESRKDYIVFNNILSFEVMEYASTN